MRRIWKVADNRYQWCTQPGSREENTCVSDSDGLKDMFCGYFNEHQQWQDYRYGTFRFARSRAYDECETIINKDLSKIQSQVEREYKLGDWSRWRADKLNVYPFCKCPFKPPPTTTQKPTAKPTAKPTNTPAPITQKAPAETEKDTTKKPTQGGSATSPDWYTKGSVPTRPSPPRPPSPPDPPRTPGDKSEPVEDLTKTVEENDDKIVTTWKNSNGRVVKEHTTVKNVPSENTGSDSDDQSETKSKIKIEYINGKKVTTKSVSGVVVERTVEDIPAEAEVGSDTPAGENADKTQKNEEVDKEDGKKNKDDKSDDGKSESSESSSSALIGSSLLYVGVLLCTQDTFGVL